MARQLHPRSSPFAGRRRTLRPAVSSRLAALIAGGLLLSACNPPAGDEFRHGLADQARPWAHANFDADPGKFTFAVFSDLTGGERPGIYDVAVAQLNLLRPELIMSVGDLIEGDSADTAGLNAEWDRFDSRSGKARAPVFYTGGNHDLTGQMLRDVWRDRYGPSYYHFVYKDVLFLVLDTEDNTPERMAWLKQVRDEALEFVAVDDWEGYAASDYANAPERAYGNIRPAQADYFIDAIESHPDARWVFLFIHKPIWQREDEAEFARIEAALSKRPYTVFRGHQHAFIYEQRHGRDYIGLGPTGGSWNAAAGRSMDQVVLVTVDDAGVDIANLLLPGILDKTGQIPANGDRLCYESTDCEDSAE